MITRSSLVKWFVLHVVVGVSFVLTGCRTYFYPTIQSSEIGLYQLQDGSFETSKDNVFVIYSFKDSGGNLVFEIINESDDPVFVDWSRSVLIAEDRALQMRDNVARFQGSAVTTTYRFSDSNYDVHSSSISGNVVLPQNDLFIPPRSSVVYSPMVLSRVLDLDIPRSFYQKRDIGHSTVRYLKFSEESTPLRFRSYLTIVNDRDKTHTVFEDQFHVSEIVRTLTKNDLLHNDTYRRGDMFYIEKVNRGVVNASWAVVGVASLAGLIWMGVNAPDVPSVSY